MPRVHLIQGQGQYQNQNAYRTISMAFMPYFPETFRYRMNVDTTFSGNRGGYFSVMPRKADNQGLIYGSKYKWKTRMDAYDAQGTGRLSTLNTYSRKDMAVESSQRLNLPMAGSSLAKDLASIISNENGKIGRDHDINNANEQELAMLGREIENFLNVGVSQPISPAHKHREGSLSPQTLDLRFEENLGLASTLGNMTSEKEIEKSLGIEVSTDVKKRFSPKQMLGDIDNARVVFDSHAKTEIAAINREIQSKIIGASRKQDGRGTIPLGESATDDQRLLETARGRFAAGTIGEIDAISRRLLSRQSEVLQDNILRNLTQDSFMEQVPLGADMQGIAVITGHIVEFNGTRVPQFEISNTYVFHGSSLSEAITIQAMRDVGTVNETKFKLATANITSRAINDAYRISARVQAEGTFLEASMDIDNIYGLSLYVGEGQAKGLQALTTPQIAKGLGEQLELLFNNKKTEKEIANFYSRMIVKSNNLTEAWKDKVPSGKVHGFPISTEWTQGVRPPGAHKKYLGIWNAKGEQTWKDGGNTGTNVSISPFLTSRREGTVRFGR